MSLSELNRKFEVKNHTESIDSCIENEAVSSLVNTLIDDHLQNVSVALVFQILF